MLVLIIKVFFRNFIIKRISISKFSKARLVFKIWFTKFPSISSYFSISLGLRVPVQVRVGLLRVWDINPICFFLIFRFEFGYLNDA